jgi:hypothetical protein
MVQRAPPMCGDQIFTPIFKRPDAKGDDAGERGYCSSPRALIIGSLAPAKRCGKVSAFAYAN